ncbi:MAG: tRNA pseudouridine(13) synthase TruD [Promethearchaeota archaeon]
MKNQELFDAEDAYEKLVGIEVFSTTVPGVGGVIKERTTDFEVREITTSQRVLSTSDSKDHTLSEPKKGHAYTVFDLVKWNADTILTVKEISRALGKPLSDFSHAGIKDNRAITAQQVSVRGIVGQQLLQLHLPNARVQNIRYSRRPVQVGDLWGNHFEILVRGVQADDLEDLESKVGLLVEQIEARGFPNYFGLQRFGTHRPNSHEIGRWLLLGDFERAIKQFLTQVFPTEGEEAREARETLAETWDFNKAASTFPKGLTYERMVLKHLASNPGDYEGAFSTLPRSLQHLLLSSFQSYQFNKVVTRRAQEGYPPHVPADGDSVFLFTEECGMPTRVRYKYEGSWKPRLDRVLKARRAAVGIPLAGYETKFDGSLTSRLVKEQLELDGVPQSSFRLEHIPRLRPFKGAHRVITVYPRNLSFRSIELKDGCLALGLSFDLPRGTYATMLLREITKKEKPRPMSQTNAT